MQALNVPPSDGRSQRSMTRGHPALSIQRSSGGVGLTASLIVRYHEYGSAAGM